MANHMLASYSLYPSTKGILVLAALDNNTVDWFGFKEQHSTSDEIKSAQTKNIICPF